MEPEPVYLMIVLPARDDVSIVGEPVVAVYVALGIPPPPDENGKPVSNGLIIFPYANFAKPARTVKVADAVLIIVKDQASMADVFPAVGAVPPDHLGVTAEPSI